MAAALTERAADATMRGDSVGDRVVGVRFVPDRFQVDALLADMFAV